MKKKMSNRDKTFWAVIIPVVILFFAFNTLPMIKGVIYSFTNYKGYGTYDYVGFRNYADLFTDSRVGKSYLFTFKYALAGTILVNVLSLIMAVGLNSAIRFKSALRGIYFVPNILGGLVIGYIFSFFFTYILPAAGQGILAVQGHKGLKYEYLSGYKDEDAWIAGTAERAFVRYLDGGCSSPVAAFGIVEGEELFLRGLYYREKDGRYFKDSIRGPKTEAARLGMCLAEQMKREHEEQENDKYTGGEPV